MRSSCYAHQVALIDRPFLHQVALIYRTLQTTIGALTPVVSGVVQVFHDLLVELWLLLVAEVEEGEEEDRQEEGWEVESGVGRVNEKQALTCMAWRWV